MENDEVKHEVERILKNAQDDKSCFENDKQRLEYSKTIAELYKATIDEKRIDFENRKFDLEVKKFEFEKEESILKRESEKEFEAQKIELEKKRLELEDDKNTLQDVNLDHEKQKIKNEKIVKILDIGTKIFCTVLEVGIPGLIYVNCFQRSLDYERDGVFTSSTVKNFLRFLKPTKK